MKIGQNRMGATLRWPSRATLEPNLVAKSLAEANLAHWLAVYRGDRISLISRSRTFLRSVLRLSPNSSAALI